MINFLFPLKILIDKTKNFDMFLINTLFVVFIFLNLIFFLYIYFLNDFSFFNFFAEPIFFFDFTGITENFLFLIDDFLAICVFQGFSNIFYSLEVLNLANFVNFFFNESFYLAFFFFDGFFVFLFFITVLLLLSLICSVSISLHSKFS